MSHLVSIETRARDPVALAAACQKLGLQPPRLGKTQVYQTSLEGWIVQLPGWTYPVVIHPQTGLLAYDNYNGQWGNGAQVGKLLQRYAAEKALLEARRAGLTPCETALPDGTLKITIGGQR